MLRKYCVLRVIKRGDAFQNGGESVGWSVEITLNQDKVCLVRDQKSALQLRIANV